MPTVSQPKVYLRLKHKETAKPMDLYKVVGQLKLILGFAQLTDLTVEIDKTSKQFVISFTPPLILPKEILNAATEGLTSVAPTVKGAFVRLEFSVGIGAFLPIFEKKKVPAQNKEAPKDEGTAVTTSAAKPNDPAPPGGINVNVGGGGGNGATGPLMVDTVGARFIVDVQCKKSVHNSTQHDARSSEMDESTIVWPVYVCMCVCRDLIDLVLDTAGFDESKIEALAFALKFPAATNFTLHTPTLRSICESWLIPLPPSFGSIAADPNGHKPARNLSASMIAKMVDPQFAAALKARRSALRRAGGGGGSGSAAPNAASSTSTATNANSAAAKTHLQWKTPDGKETYYVELTESDTSKASLLGSSGAVTDVAPASFVAYPAQQLSAMVPPFAMTVIEMVQKTLFSAAATAKEVSGATFLDALTVAIKQIPLEAKRVVAMYRTIHPFAGTITCNHPVFVCCAEGWQRMQTKPYYLSRVLRWLSVEGSVSRLISIQSLIFDTFRGISSQKNWQKHKTLITSQIALRFTTICL